MSDRLDASFAEVPETVGLHFVFIGKQVPKGLFGFLDEIVELLSLFEAKLDGSFGPVLLDLDRQSLQPRIQSLLDNSHLVVGWLLLKEIDSVVECC